MVLGLSNTSSIQASNHKHPIRHLIVKKVPDKDIVKYYKPPNFPKGTPKVFYYWHDFKFVFWYLN